MISSRQLLYLLAIFLGSGLTYMLMGMHTPILLPPGDITVAVVSTPLDNQLQEQCFNLFIEKSTEKSEIGSVPWLDDGNVRLICSVLHGELDVLEWGCGGSTVFFSRFVKNWTCIEHVPNWGTKVQEFLKNEPHRDRVSVVVVEPSKFYNAKIPAGSNNDGTYEQFREYIEYPVSLGRRFGLIIDDGRARVEAAQSALSNKLLDEDGVLIIHDWERQWYHKVLKMGFKIYEEDKSSRRKIVALKASS